MTAKKLEGFEVAAKFLFSDNEPPTFFAFVVVVVLFVKFCFLLFEKNLSKSFLRSFRQLAQTYEQNLIGIAVSRLDTMTLDCVLVFLTAG